MNGAILSVPFGSGASGMQNETLNCDLHLHVQRVGGENELLFTAVSVGGSYHARTHSQKEFIRIPLPYWTDYISYLCGEADFHQPRWALSAKLVDSGLLSPLIQSAVIHSKEGSPGVVVSVKTRDELPITMGSIELKAKEVTNPLRERESHLFKWLSALQSRNNGLVAQVNSVMHARDQLKRELEEVRVAYREAVKEHALIAGNLERAFYTLLNAKKDKIWELLKGSAPQYTLDHLISLPAGDKVQAHQMSLVKVDPDEEVVCNTNSELRESIYECYDANLPIASTMGKGFGDIEKNDIEEYAETRLMRTASMSRFPPDGRRHKRAFSELSSEGDSDDGRTEEDKDGPESEISAELIGHVDRCGKFEVGMEKMKVKREPSEESMRLMGGECYEDANITHTNATSSARPTRSIETLTFGAVGTEVGRSFMVANTSNNASLPVIDHKMPMPGDLAVKREVKSTGLSTPSHAITGVDDATDYELSDSDD